MGAGFEAHVVRVAFIEALINGLDRIGSTHGLRQKWLLMVKLIIVVLL